MEREAPMKSLSEEVFSWWQSSHKQYSHKVALIAEKEATEVLRDIHGLSPSELSITYEQCGTKGYVTLASYDGTVRKEHLSMYVICLVYTHLSVRNDCFDLTNWLRFFLQYHNIGLDGLAAIITAARTIQSYDGTEIGELLEKFGTKTKTKTKSNMEDKEKIPGMFNNNFNDNYGVIISSGGNNVTIHIGEGGLDMKQTPMTIDQILELQEQMIRKRKAEEADMDEITEDDDLETVLPDVLNTKEALCVLTKLHKAGLLTADFKPASSLSLTEKVVLASMISQTLWEGKNRWKPFQEYWRINNMSSLYTPAMNQNKSGAFIAKINEALK